MVSDYILSLWRKIYEAYDSLELDSLDNLDERWMWLGGTWAVCMVMAFIASYLVPKEPGIYMKNIPKDKPYFEENTESAPKIESVGEGFDYTKATPIKHRPFKAGKYHMTMGIQKCDANDMFKMESTYLDRVKLRREIIAKNPDISVFCENGPDITAAVVEFYDKTWRFLVKRYPMYFSENLLTGHFVNHAIDNERYPLSGAYAVRHGYKPYDLLRIISRNVEEDFLILTYDETTDPPMYRLQAGSSCFPAGFNPKEKFGLSLRDIHGPVPMYREKLEVSMNKFFRRIEPHQFVQRQNWGIQRGTNMFAIGEYHVYDQGKAKVYKDDEIDFSKWFLRCENQILTRLPATKALTFMIRTYTTPVTEIKQEQGIPEALCSAIDALPENIYVYKGAQEWGPPLKRFLQAQTDSN